MGSWWGHCCVGGTQSKLFAVPSQSGGAGEFDEGRRERIFRVGIHSEFVRGYVPGFERVKIPEPAVTDRATAAAHLAAFGSANVRRL